MAVLLLLMRRMLALIMEPIFTVLTNRTGDFLYKMNTPVDKSFVKQILLILAAAGPLTVPQLAGVLDLTAGNKKLFYTIEEMKASGALSTYAISGTTKWLCVNGYEGSYVPLSDHDLRLAVMKSKSKDDIGKVTDNDIKRPPTTPVFGQAVITPFLVEEA
jgi:hypothetical protein